MPVAVAGLGLPMRRLGCQAVDVDMRRQGEAASAAGSRAGLPADPDEVQLLLVEDEADAPPDAGPTAGFVTARHRLADHAALWLAEPPRGRADQSMTAELDVAVDEVPELAEVFTEAPEVVAAWPAGAVRVARGRGGVVVRIHGEAGSVVFRIGGRVLVVLDAMPASVLRVDRDRDWAAEVSGMVDAVMRELDRRAPGGDRDPGV
jgi:hypothetical protein